MRYNKQNRVVVLQLDTLRPNDPIPNNLECLNISRGYYFRFGICISNYFKVEEVVANNKKNSSIDSFAILSPLSLIPYEDFGGKCIREYNSLDSRLLLIIFKDKKEKKTLILENIISNDATIAYQTYENIELKKDGFRLSASKGQGYVFSYTIDIKEKNESFYVDKIFIEPVAGFRNGNA